MFVTAKQKFEQHTLKARNSEYQMQMLSISRGLSESQGCVMLTIWRREIKLRIHYFY